MGSRAKARSKNPLGYGVIGNTSDSGSFVLGSSPGTPALTVRLLKSGCFALIGLCENLSEMMQISTLTS